MAFTTYDGLIAAFTAGKGQDRYFNKTSTNITLVTGAAYSLWMQDSYPAAGLAGAGAAGAFASQTSATTGALPLTNPAGGETLHLVMTGAQASAASAGTMMIYDRVGQVESLAVDATGLTASATTIARYATEGTMVMAECATATFTTAAFQWRLSKYTNQSGTANKVSKTMLAFTGSSAKGRLAYLDRFFVDLAAGDTGVRSIEEFECTVSNATAASKIQLVFAKPLVMLPLSVANVRVERDLVLTTIRLPKVEDNACLAFAVLPATTTAQTILGDLSAVSG